MAIKKLIEVALPLEKINEAAAYEKMPGIGPHPRGLHQYWARRPLAAARAVIWASLVDDPSSHPELFPTEEAQSRERNRLFKILENIVPWSKSNDENVLNTAKAEILRYTNNNPPVFLDPFSGGGAIPLEAQRLGLESHAQDLNPLAVMINKAMIEIPAKFKNCKPIHPDSDKGDLYQRKWVGASGIAEDLRYYGNLLKQKASERIGYMYPKVSVTGGVNASVVCWLWSKTVVCPNPTCGCDLPLVRSFIISKKKGKIVWAEPVYTEKKVSFNLHASGKPTIDGTINRKGAVCPRCGSPVGFEYIREECKNERMFSTLMAVVADGGRTKLYLPATDDQIAAADVPKPKDCPCEPLAFYPGHLNTNIYGLNTFDKLFTNRQLTSLITFSDLIENVKQQIIEDAKKSSLSKSESSLAEGGDGANAYADALHIYLAFCIDRLADFSTRVSRWSVSNEKAMNCFSKQAIPMTWDFPEVNVLGDAVGGFSTIVDYIADCVDTLPTNPSKGYAIQHDAQVVYNLHNVMVSTDPPYYDNIGYADLSDFFYVWMRRSLHEVCPDVFQTVLTPKKSELVATPYRFDSDTDKAKKFFENGMFEACKRIYDAANSEIPVTIYYAYKQSETDEDEGEDSKIASSGWETMLSAIVNAGFAITGTWPMRTEQAYRSISMGSNALASSIVLVCRKRPEDAPTTTRRNFIQELKRELKSSLQKLQSSNIAPVDMAQSAIGPGMGVFSKYTQVLEADGTPMSVRSALQIINQELDLYFNEQDGELDSNSRFCVDFYTQYGFNDAKFGDADTLARAKNTSVATLQSKGVIIAEKGVAHLVDRDNLPEKVDFADNMVWLFTQRLTRAMSTGGIKACASLIHNVHSSLPEQAKALAYRLHSIAERKGWQEEAFAYNSLVIAWTDIQMAAANIHEREKNQIEMDI